MTFILQQETDGLSFAARAVLATTVALSFEFQSEQIPARSIMACLGLSDDAWISTRDELFEASRLFAAHDPSWTGELVSLWSGAKLLREAIGYPGRPSGRHWNEIRAETFKEHGRVCVYCGDTSGPLSVDHIVPVARGGSNHFSNFVPACRSCNSSKGAKLVEEWWPTTSMARRSA